MEITAAFSCFLLLLLLCTCLNCQGCMEEERDALLQIKTSINTPEGTALPSWYEKDCCRWEGVECDAATTRVTGIFIYNQRNPSLLENWYPNATPFAQFKDLKIVELPGNRIKGFTSPNELQKLKHLQRLNLQYNLIDNGSHLWWGKGALPSLSSLDLSNNKLKGFIPECLCDSLVFTELFLSDNSLGGRVSSCVSNMTSLEVLDLSNNQFIDSLASFQFHNLPSIKSLLLSRNKFKGKVSFSIFANLSRLRDLDLSYNAQLEMETESQTRFPSINLTVLSLAGCNLRKIPSFLSTQNNLEHLDLSENFLVGNVPSWLIHNTTLQLWVGGNKLSGPFPKTFQNTSSRLTSLDISNNSFQGPLLEDIHLIFPQLLYLNASNNCFNGGVPPSFGRLKRLQYLDLSCNKLHGEILMTGNTSSLQHLILHDNYLRGDALPRNLSLPKLKILNLAKNDLTGIFLTSDMSSLEYLNLHDNNLRGDALPRNLSLPELTILDLAKNDLRGIFLDNLLWSLSQSPAVPQLRILILRGNNLEGQITLQLCQIRSLQILDLSENRLSGDIPDCFDNITSWTEMESPQDIPNYDNDLHYLDRPILDLSSNRLSGSIPVQITRLTAMSGLNLSSNLLVGQIPVSVGNLTKLEWLDLSNNKLFGELCQELTNLVFLSFFDVSYNNLSGSIPLGHQFNTFENSSYLGNPGLCGLPLSRKCGVVIKNPSHAAFPNMATTHNLLFPPTVFVLSINFILFY